MKLFYILYIKMLKLTQNTKIKYSKKNVLNNILINYKQNIDKIKKIKKIKKNL